jgi:uncharacterized protein
MSISMYIASVPPIVRSLRNLRGILEKAAAHVEARKIDPSVLINMRLYPDMLPFSRQIQIASDNAKGGICRLAGIDPPVYEDTESTFPELVARIDKTIAFLQTFKPQQIDGAEERTIKLKMHERTVTFQGMPYLLEYLLPNFYFHVVTAYAILRHSGVEIGKRDYLGSVQ